MHLTRFANSHIHQNVDEESADVFLTIHKDGKTISRSKNITAVKSSKEFVKEALGVTRSKVLMTQLGLGLLSKTESL